MLWLSFDPTLLFITPLKTVVDFKFAKECDQITKKNFPWFMLQLNLVSLLMRS